jgi:predicted enzyme related to lactoylglutathione lyase
VRALELLGLQPGQTVLVNGAAGGVGTAAVQIARARGARVFGTAGESNHDFLRELGAEPTTYGDGLVERVRELGGADLAFDTAGAGAIPELVEIAGSPDRVITIADYAAPEYGVRVTGGQDGRYVHALAEAAEQFYGGLFGWTFQEIPDAAGYRVISNAGRSNGGIMPRADAHAAWLPYFGHDDVGAVAGELEGLGARPLGEVVRMPQGSILPVMDPQGAVFSIWTGLYED